MSRKIRSGSPTEAVGQSLLGWVTNWVGHHSPIRILLALLLLWPSSRLLAQSIVINEIQTFNRGTLSDEGAGTPDWIELHNPSPETADLAGYGLSDDPGSLFKWVFTNASIPPRGFLLVYASGEDRQPSPVAALHPTNVAGLTVWLRADAVSPLDPAQARESGGSFFVRNWRDQSGQGRHAQNANDASQPLYISSALEFNGRPVLRFDGTNDVLYLPAPPAANHFCVLAVVRASGPHEVDAQSSGGVGGVSGQKYLFGAQHGGDYEAGAGLSVGTNGASVYEHGANYMPAVAVAKSAGTAAAVVAMNYSNRQPALWVQGSLAAHGSVSARTNVTAPVEIGAGAYGAFAGDVAEVVYFSRTITHTELLGIQQYFAEKYGLEFPRRYHTSFKLEADGEPVILTRSDGRRVDLVPAVKIPRDLSYGRQPDGATNFFYFEQPTPGAPNTTPGATNTLGPPQFSAPAGFYSNAITVSILNTNQGAQIRYTLDGSYPTTNSSVYSGPLGLDSRAGTANEISMIPTAGGWQPPQGEVFKAHVLRACVFQQGMISSPTITATYVIDPRGRARYSLPVVSLATDRANFFDPNIGIYVCGNAPGCNYAQAGDAWERPIHVEFFETNGVRTIAQESGVRMHGNTSFGFPIKALRLHPLNQKGGEPFRYRIFPDLPIEEFSRLLLRPSGHDHYLTMMRDGLMQGLVREVGLDLQGYRPAIVFLDGEYWGIHNLQEAYEKNYFTHHHPGVDADAVDYLEGYAPGAFAYEGDSAAYDQLYSFIQTHDLRQETNFASVQTLMEVDNYRDYKVAETFYYRWDIGNQRLWRPRVEGGRLRWILFDCDVGYGGFWSQPTEAPWTFNMVAYNLEPNGPWQNYQPGNDHNAPALTALLRSLIANSGYKRNLINRFADLMNTTFSTDRMIRLIDRMSAEIAPEMAEHCARWRAPADWPTWSNNVQRLRDFAVNRPEYMRRHLTNQFGLRGWLNLTLSIPDTNAGAIQVNTITIVAPTNAPWTGVYFRDNYVSISAQPKPGYRLKNWQGLYGAFATNVTNTFMLGSSLTLQANFEALPTTNAPAPAPYNLALGPYVLSRWSPTQPAGTYPPNMVLLQTATHAGADPDLSADLPERWTLPYDRSSRSRFLGLSDYGLGFLNTSDPQIDGGGYLGGAVLALNTTGRSSLRVTWRGRTVAPGSRLYAIRLQYRVGVTNAFADLPGPGGQPVEYPRGSLPGDSEIIGPTPLPPGLHGQPNVQLRWRYYWVSGAEGPRDLLALDDIMVTEGLVTAPRLASMSCSPAAVIHLDWLGLPQLVYSPETSTNLLDWLPMEPAVAAPDGSLGMDGHYIPGDPVRFYRLRWP